MLNRLIGSRLLPLLARRSAEVWARLRNPLDTPSPPHLAAALMSAKPSGTPLPASETPGSDSDDQDPKSTAPAASGGDNNCNCNSRRKTAARPSPRQMPPPPKPPPASPPRIPPLQKPPPPSPGKTPKLPKILYIPNPIIWLTNKIDFSLLRYEWDPKFSEGEFRRGATQAVCTITQLVAEKQTVELRGLLTRRALAQLELEVESKWGDLQRRFIAVEPSNVQIALPRRVHFRTSAHNDSSVASEKKMCDVDMIFIALKWIEAGAARAIVFVEIMARFHREYTQGVIPEWTVSAFKVSRFNIMPR